MHTAPRLIPSVALGLALLLFSGPGTVEARNSHPSAAASLVVTLTTGPANLDWPETYRLRISVPAGEPGFSSIGPVVDTLPPGAVFNGATPAADCQPGCVGTTPATVTWTSPCTVPLMPGNNCDISANLTFPSATFPSGTNVTHSFTADGTPLDGTPLNLGQGSLTHPVTTFVASPDAYLDKSIAPGSPGSPALDQVFSYELLPDNTGNVPLDDLTVVDTLPAELDLTQVTTGAYANINNFAAGEGVRVSYEKNTAPGIFTLWGSSPGAATNTTLTAPPPGLGAGEYITRVRWQYGQAQPEMAATTRPWLTGRIINPDHTGGAVSIGDSIQNCAALSALYSAGPANVSRSDCQAFTLSPFLPDLVLAKSDGGVSVAPGELITYTLSYTNTGNRTATGITLAETVPAFTTFDAGASTAGWSCAGGSGVGTACTLAVSNLTTGASGEAIFVLRVVNPVPVATTQVSNTAGIADDGSGGADPTPDNNNAGDTTPLLTSVDVAIDKTATPLTALPGQPVTYTLTFSASGNIAAGSVYITDTIPAGLTGVSYTSSGVPLVDTGIVPGYVWAAGDLAPGVTGVITVSGVVSPELAAGTILANIARIESAHDSTPGNNSAQADVTVLNPDNDRRLLLPFISRDSAGAPGLALPRH